MIRKYDPEDRLYVLDVDNKSYNFAWSDDIWNRVGSMIRVADSNGRVVGFCVPRMNECFIEILKLAVTPGYRRQGIGSMLLKDAENNFPMVVGIKAYSFEIEPMIFLRKHGFKFFKKSGSVYCLKKELI